MDRKRSQRMVAALLAAGALGLSACAGMSQKAKGAVVGATTGAAVGGVIGNQTGSTDIFIYPPYQFRAVDVLLTNFHLPRSTLLMLVSAFAGREFLLSAYQEAIREGYRFYSYGDCMLIL